MAVVAPSGQRRNIASPINIITILDIAMGLLSMFFHTSATKDAEKTTKISKNITPIALHDQSRYNPQKYKQTFFATQSITSPKLFGMTLQNISLFFNK
ncbi:hypothetical protein FACS1894122_08780 [Alphaproteobacteria bacterium]|nr:hypothetical protein FACS1894122_08780 [Alphaproteobacteria bacterium]